MTTEEEFMRGTPVEYNGLGKHAATRFIARWYHEPDLPVNTLKVIPAPGHIGPSVRQMCGSNRAISFFRSLHREAES